MHSFIRIVILALFGLAPITALQAQGTSPAAKSEKSAAAATSKRTDVYHVFIVKAALGKAKELQAWLKEPDPDHPDRKGILLRHQDGDSWDYVAIEHIGDQGHRRNGRNTHDAKPTDADPNGTPIPSSPARRGRNLRRRWDSTATPPRRPARSTSVSDYRAAPGHRDELEKMLTRSADRGIDTSSGNVLFVHIEGAPWNFLGIARYDSWEKFAENEKNSIAQTNKDQGGWFELRQHTALHHDTLTDRIHP